MKLGWCTCDFRVCYTTDRRQPPEGLSNEERHAWLIADANSPEGRADRAKWTCAVPIIQDDGSFEVPGLPPGKYTLEINVAPYDKNGPSYQAWGRVSTQFTVPDSGQPLTIDLGELQAEYAPFPAPEPQEEANSPEKAVAASGA